MSGSVRMSIPERIIWWAVGTMGSLVIRLTYLTLRIREVGLDNLEQGRRLGTGAVIYAIWHGRLLGNCYNNRNQGICVMISRHRDGEIIARIVEKLGFLTARGSVTRGAASALKLMLHTLRTGHDLGLTVDGPKGPPLEVKPGAVYASAQSGCPVVPLSVGYSSCWHFSSWDRFQFPKPFSRMVVGYGPPIQVPKKLDEQEVARWCKKVEIGINRVAALCGNLARPIKRKAVSLMFPLLEKFLTRERNRLLHLPLLMILCPAELAYRLLWLLREKLYDSGWLKPKPPPVPALCVGSLFLGGAGKTPLAMLIARTLAERGTPAAVLTRGYGGSRQGRKEVLVIHPGDEKKYQPGRLASWAGDEAALLARCSDKIGVVVCSDRSLGAEAAVAELGAQALVLDDGFGHRRFGRTMDLLLVPDSLVRTTGHLFPAGYLREPRTAAGRARAIVLIRLAGLSAPAPRITWAEGKQVLVLHKSASALTPLADWLSREHQAEEATLSIQTLQGKNVLAFCGIAHPESFRAFVASLDPAHLEVVAYPDHHLYSLRDQQWLRARARDSGAVLATTEKDAVKLDPASIGADCLVLGLKLEESQPGTLDSLLEELLRSHDKKTCQASQDRTFSNLTGNN